MQFGNVMTSIYFNNQEIVTAQNCSNSRFDSIPFVSTCKSGIVARWRVTYISLSVRLTHGHLNGSDINAVRHLKNCTSELNPPSFWQKVGCLAAASKN
jgi:hypothetical protein